LDGTFSSFNLVGTFISRICRQLCVAHVPLKMCVAHVHISFETCMARVPNNLPWRVVILMPTLNLVCFLCRTLSLI
jgi:hypothetical protein